jgi:glycosyltransferase involved in cell wall biosynthesis
MSPAKVTLILSTYESPAALEKVLHGLDLQVCAPDEILIADDGSGKTTRDLIEKWRTGRKPPVRHLWQPNKGFRKTVILNQAVAAATGDYVVLLDGDCVPHACFLSDHKRLAEPGCWVQGRRCFVKEPFAPEFSADNTPVWWWLLSGRITGVGKAVRLPFPVVRRDQAQRGIIGCNMGFWRDDLVAVNGFDEGYSGWGIGEDSDVGTRLYHLGRRRKFVYGRAVIYHLNHPMLPRGHVAASHERLAETIRSRRVRCDRGLDQYLGGSHHAADHAAGVK